MYDDVIKLVGKGYTKLDTNITVDSGEKVDTSIINVPGQGRQQLRKEKEIFAKVLSIGQQEFYQSQATGLKPELKFEIADYLDYNSEKELIYNDVKYQILRTFRKNGKSLEITVYGGVNIGTT